MKFRCDFYDIHEIEFISDFFARRVIFTRKFFFDW